MRLRVAAATIGLLFAVASAPVALRAQAPVLHIPVLLSLTGTAAFVGKGEALDFKLIQDLVNKRGGINGRQIACDIQDDESNTQTTLQLTNGVLASKAGPDDGADTDARLQRDGAARQRQRPRELVLEPGNRARTRRLRVLLEHRCA